MIVDAIKTAYNDMQKRGWDRMYFFLDIHSTILKPNYEYGNIPKEFYPMAKETLQVLSERPEICLILYTCSHPNEIEQYLQYFEENGIHFDYVNENPEVKTQLNGYGCYDSKPYMNVLFEDKAGFIAETEWHQVYSFYKITLKYGLE